MNIIKNEEGVAAIEFVLCFSLLFFLFLGSVEITRYVLIIQKTEAVVSTVADVTAQTQTTPPLTTAQFLTQESNLLGTTADIMNPYSFSNNGIVIITDITQAGTNNPIVNWQTCGGGTMSASSKIGKPGSAAILPVGYAMNAGEEIIVAEVFYNYSPMLIGQDIVKSQTVYRTSIFVPRGGMLNTFSSSCN